MQEEMQEGLEYVKRSEFEALKQAFDEYMKKSEPVQPVPIEPKKPKVKREPSKYNIFMSTEIKKIKERNPDMPPKDLFKFAVENWKKQNPPKKTTVINN